MLVDLGPDFRRRCEAMLKIAGPDSVGFLGRRRDLRLAGGTEVTGYYDYTSGAELKYVDWARCARHDELVVKEFRGSVDYATYFVVDAGPTMSLAGGEKRNEALRLAAALGYLSLARTDRVAAILFANDHFAWFPPRRGRPAIPAWLSFMASGGMEAGSRLAADATGRRRAGFRLSRREDRGGLAAAVRQLVTRVGAGLTVIVSDFLAATDVRRPLDLLRRAFFQPVLLQVVAEDDVRPAYQGLTTLYDPAVHSRVRRRIREEDVLEYRDIVATHIRELKGYCYRYGIGFAQFNAQAELLTNLRRALALGR